MMCKNLLTVHHINFIESFNFSLYGLLFAILPSMIFYSLNNKSYFLDLTYLTLLASFISRPIGRIILGYMADRHEKTLSLKISLTCIFLASFIIMMCKTLYNFSVSATYILLFIIKELSISTKYSGLLYICSFLGSLAA